MNRKDPGLSPTGVRFRWTTADLLRLVAVAAVGLGLARFLLGLSLHAAIVLAVVGGLAAVALGLGAPVLAGREPLPRATGGLLAIVLGGVVILGAVTLGATLLLVSSANSPFRVGRGQEWLFGIPGFFVILAGLGLVAILRRGHDGR